MGRSSSPNNVPLPHLRSLVHGGTTALLHLPPAPTPRHDYRHNPIRGDNVLREPSRGLVRGGSVSLPLPRGDVPLDHATLCPRRGREGLAPSLPPCPRPSSTATSSNRPSRAAVCAEATYPAAALRPRPWVMPPAPPPWPLRFGHRKFPWPRRWRCVAIRRVRGRSHGNGGHVRDIHDIRDIRRTTLGSGVAGFLLPSPMLATAVAWRVAMRDDFRVLARDDRATRQPAVSTVGTAPLPFVWLSLGMVPKGGGVGGLPGRLLCTERGCVKYAGHFQVT